MREGCPRPLALGQESAGRGVQLIIPLHTAQTKLVIAHKVKKLSRFHWGPLKIT